MDLGTYNPNRYGLNVDAIDLVAKLFVNQTNIYSTLRTNQLTSFASLVDVVGQPKTSVPPGYYPSNSSQIGTATYGSIYFPAKSWVNYTMIFQFSYTPDPVGLLKDPTILELADSCGVTTRRGLNIAILKPLGYAPTVSGNIYINCPFSQDQIHAVIEKVQSGMSAFQASRLCLVDQLSMEVELNYSEQKTDKMCLI
ncbi:hypothetical protein BCR33DRAFT_780472 [Rhizoclosmatium globosum]|uniref:Uncharacterized protein n=1 Tax=Rhizoclosmatium globosum TaxID=329046 RepID=A0A1Y2CWV5_9FUNG|nr:hypothetical protein BCR33DRAFT_780472 [Rhizoclosmatium globosum]|eukprot:ORY51509.1 hypothetical protein BCR33DRAFT_780472 [Rhizoclosmatium globosum]